MASSHTITTTASRQKKNPKYTLTHFLFRKILTQNPSFSVSLAFSEYQMNSSETSSIPSKTSKKALFHSRNPNPNQLSSKTPEKLAQLPRRGRSLNRGVALSINEVRKVAESLHGRSPGQSGRPKSATRQIESWPDESPARKPKKPAGEPVKLPEK